MIGTLKYKSYFGSIEFSQEDDCLFGRLLHISDSISYEGNSVKEIRAAFREAVDDYIDTCKKMGKSPEKPHSGKVMFRIAPSTHAKAARAAAMAGMSLNQWAERALEREAEKV